MRCVVDTNVIVDVMDDDPRFGRPSADRLQNALQGHALVVPPFVVCELLCGGKSQTQVDGFLRGSRIEFIENVPLEAYSLAAERFRLYLARHRRDPGVVECPACGRNNRPTCSECGEALAARRLPMDYLIGAFALCSGDSRILTRDAGVYGRDFRDVRVV